MKYHEKISYEREVTLKKFGVNQILKSNYYSNFLKVKYITEMFLYVDQQNFNFKELFK